MTTVKGFALATAAAAAFILTPVSFAADDAAAATTGDQVKCTGVNSCKGTGACKTANNACKGQNACKGKGFMMLTKEDCEKQGGTVMADEGKTDAAQ